MRLIDHTLPTIDENLAFDEALLCDSTEDLLRFWEPTPPAVVLGRSSDVTREINLPACREAKATVHRRVSGGATIVTGRGCLMYAVSLSVADRPELGGVDHVHAFVLDRVVGALQGCNPTVQRAGTSDLVYSSKHSQTLVKFSGNSLRLTRSRVLYHGTLLYDFNLELISKLLKMPPREPEYRASRAHREFVGNLSLGASRIKQLLAHAWSADAIADHQPFLSTVRELVDHKYSNPEWTQGARAHASPTTP